MTHLIDKDTLVAEIKRLKESFVNERDDFEKGYHHSLDMVLCFLDTLEVKEVDLEKEIQLWVEDNSVNGYYQEDVYETAEHFFELGMSVRNKARKE